MKSKDDDTQKIWGHLTTTFMTNTGTFCMQIFTCNLYIKNILFILFFICFETRAS